MKEDIGLLGDCLQDLGVGVDLEDVVLGFGGHFEVEVGVSDELLDVERLDAEVLLEIAMHRAANGETVDAAGGLPE